MRKIMSMLLAVMMCCGLLVGCGGSGSTEELEHLKKENEQLRLEIEQLKGESEEIDENTPEEMPLDEMILNEPYEVNTENGTYKITMQGAEQTDWYQKEDGKNVIIIKYEVENVDFATGTMENGKDGCLIDQYAFKVSDENGYILNTWNSTLSAYGFPEIISPGYKAKVELPYIVEGVTEYIDVVYYRHTGDIAKIRLDVE